MSSDTPSPFSPTDILRTALRESSSSSSSDDLILSLLSTFSLSTSSTTSSSIPSLTSSSKANSLVSFRCMLQDTTYPTEIFLPLLEGEEEEEAVEEEGAEIDYSKLRERGVVFAVGVPGEQGWVEEILNPSSASSSSTSNDEPESEPHKSIAHKFPYLQAKTGHFASRSERIGAFIKTYDTTTPSPPTTVQTYIGLLTFSSPPSALESDHQTTEDEIPTLHVLQTIPHKGPLVPLENLPALNTAEEWEEARRELVRWIAEVGLGGEEEEEWVAEWVLVGLCGKNLPPLTPLTISLLLPSSSPSTATTTTTSPLPLLSLLPHVLPLFHPLPLSLPLLNLSSLSPHSTPTEDLAAGALQLPHGGFLCIDETPLGEGGKLSERGMRNLEVVKKLVKEQKIEYEFEYSKFGFGTDLGGLVVGEGRGGLVEVDAKIHLHNPSTPFATAPLVLPSNDKLMKFRSIIARAREGTLVVPKEVSESIQTTFVTHRSTHGPSSLTPESLSLRMKLARGLALSHNLATLDLATWEEAWKLDEKRIERSKEGEASVTMLGKPDGLKGVKEEEEEEEESEDELEIEGGPVGGTASGKGKRVEKMVGR
ncbi:hypothetical protein BDY24DRAFT_370138 [Mrakia frigida]|uniref:uncharacterized protein n=1 Tax=Mrakia frigida TaxID=29902 RepID=UPI003FCBFCF9